MLSGKVWGTTENLLTNSTLELHRIKAKNGGYCSKHKHKNKFNLFYVISGTLEIHVWKEDYDLIDVTKLSAGDSMAVPPGEFHRFYATSDCEGLELYWSANLDPGDIVRETKGNYIDPNRNKKD
jgi:quercetin dioxygenase-like cupin family protein